MVAVEQGRTRPVDAIDLVAGLLIGEAFDLDGKEFVVANTRFEFGEDEIGEYASIPVFGGRVSVREWSEVTLKGAWRGEVDRPGARRRVGGTSDGAEALAERLRGRGVTALVVAPDVVEVRA